MGIGAGIGSIIGSLVGNSQASGDQAQAQQLALQAYQQLANSGLPPDMAQQVILQQFKSAGNLTPELEQAINLGPSALAQVQANPTTVNAQMAALQQLQQAGQTGNTAQGQLAMLNNLNQTNAATQGNMQQIVQNAQARGEGGSGASLAAQLQAAQGGANQAQQGGLQAAAQAQQQALSAIGQSGQLANQIQGQQFNEASTKAQAADQFQRFNVQNQQNVANQNVGMLNQAQQYNLANAQQLQNQNTGQANQEAERQLQGANQTYNETQARNQAIANAALGYSQNLQGQANAIRNQDTGIGGAIGGVAEGIGQMAFGMPSSGGGGGTSSYTGTDLSGTSGADTSQAYANMYGAPTANNYNGGVIEPKYRGGPVDRPMYMFDDGGQVPSLDQDKVKKFQSGYDQPAGDRASQQLHNLASALGFASGGMIPGEESMPINNEAMAKGRHQAVYNAHPLNEQNMHNYGNSNLSEHYFNTPNSGNSMPPSQYAMGGQLPSAMPQGLSPQQIAMLSRQLAMKKQMMMPMLNGGYINSQHGSIIPGKANVPGDNLANDKVHVLASPDEIVLPRSITTQPDAPERAKEFVKGILAAKRNHKV